MKKQKLLLLLIIACSTLLMQPIFGQVRFVALECKDELLCINKMKDVTVHVIVKDFCDDSKPYKKILEKEWKYSKLIFDYSEKYDNVNENSNGIYENGEWYMYLERSTRSGVDGGEVIGSELSTDLFIGKAMGKKSVSIKNVIQIPLFPAPGKDVGIPLTSISQKVDISKNFFNLANEYYLKNILQVLNQFVDKHIGSYMVYKKTGLSCESLAEVLASTLYVPQSVLVRSSKYKDEIEYVDPAEYLKGYESNYKILTNDEIMEMFKANKSFYYLLCASEAGIKYNFIVESITGKIMCVSNRIGYNISKNDMLGLFENLKSKEYCK